MTKALGSRPAVRWARFGLTGLFNGDGTWGTVTVDILGRLALGIVGVSVVVGLAAAVAGLTPGRAVAS